jgi:hypothetical protein
MTVALSLLFAVCLVNLGLTVHLFMYIKRSKGKPARVGPPTKEEFAQALIETKGLLDETAEWLEIEKAARKPKPIHHNRMTGPTTSKASTLAVIGYYVSREHPNDPPFLAQWYEKGSTPEDRDRSFENRSMVPNGFTPNSIIPPDSYVDEAGHMLGGVQFRSRYAASEAVMEVSKVAGPTRQHQIVDVIRPQDPQVVATGKKLPPARTSALITAKSGIQLTPEEEEALVKEYEVGKSPVSHSELVQAITADPGLSETSKHNIAELVNQRDAVARTGGWSPSKTS